MVQETGFFPQDIILRNKCLCLLPGHQHIAVRLARLVKAFIIDYLPAAVAQVIDIALSILLRFKSSVFINYSISIWVLLAFKGNKLCVHFHNAVICGTVNIHIHAKNKEMLMV